MRDALQAIEIAFDRAFPPADNPWRNLGALSFLLFWIVAATGIYVYIGFETRADGAYASVERLSSNAFPMGSFARSLHRYASDAFVVVTLLHLAREWIRGRYAHVRRFSWTTGVVVLWLLFASGIGGFWLVWDELAQYSLVATLEWLDALPGFDGSLARNVIVNAAVGDRLFSLLIFLHIGLPLALLATICVHLLRLAQPGVAPPRWLALGTVGALSSLALVRPVTSAPPADVGTAAETLALDWFYLAFHAFADATAESVLWLAVTGVTMLLIGLPWVSRAARMPRPRAAQVDVANCNGCGRCVADCPYAAVTLQPRSDGRTLPWQAVVDTNLCAGCGICAGACPSSTPFRAARSLVSGIDVPHATIDRLRAQLDAALGRLERASGGTPAIVVFGCTGDPGVGLAHVADAHTVTLQLSCAGQLPPSFVEYTLRSGADGVLITGCREGDCEYRLGNRYAADRLAGRRAPRLRRTIPPGRVRIAWVGRGGGTELARVLAAFRAELATTDEAGHAA